MIRIRNYLQLSLGKILSSQLSNLLILQVGLQFLSLPAGRIEQ